MIDYSAEVSGWHQCHQQTMQLKHYNVWLFTVVNIGLTIHCPFSVFSSYPWFCCAVSVCH